VFSPISQPTSITTARSARNGGQRGPSSSRKTA
jgi:hypothetical protein